ncbi:MAG: hypothetical protein Kow0059_11430 [Candidatus Sumerlaeia bacterium]
MAPRFSIVLVVLLGVLAATSAAPAQSSRFGFGKETLTQDLKTPPSPAAQPAPMAHELQEGEVRVESSDFLHVDQENDTVYGRQRTRVFFKRFMLEADRMLVDLRSREIQASGNVVLQAEGEVYRADSARYNYETYQGVGFNVTGQRGNFYFRANPFKEEKTGQPSFQRLDENESLFRHSAYTSCDFPVPHYKVVAKEVSFFLDDRVFVKNAVIYVRGIPLMWLPAYTFSLVEASPWSFRVGYDSDLGATLAVAYDFHHYTRVPRPGGKGLQTRDRGSASLRGEWYSQRGYGADLTYKYTFDYGRHKGVLDYWAFRDSERGFEDELDALERSRKDTLFEDAANQILTDDDGGDGGWKYRWRVLWLHRSQLSDSLYATVNIDAVRDPEVFDDILDIWAQQKRYRVPERRGRAAITDRHDDWLWRVLVDVRDRIGRDRLTNFAEQGDDDADFDIDPERLRARKRLQDALASGEDVDPANLDDDNNDDEEGIPPSRWGRVSKRYPQVTVATSYLPLRRRNLYYQVQLDILRNLDKGLNVLDKHDDSYVIGFDLYQSLSHLWRISRDVTLLSKVGVGLARYDREQDSYNYRFPPGAFAPPADPSAPQTVFYYPNVNWVDEDTFLVGERWLPDPVTGEWRLVGGREVSVLDVDKNYFYADIEERLNMRFTDTLDGYLRWFFREGTDNSLGEFYESIGNVLAREDIYDFRTPQHWIEARLNYRLLYPNISMFLSARRNLQSGDDIHSKEIITEANAGVNYTSPRQTVSLDAGVGYFEQQLRDRSDVFEFSQNSVFAYGGASYRPLSGKWWARIFATYFKNLERDPADKFFEDLARRQAEEQGVPFEDSGFDENDDQVDITTVLGGHLGPKYIVEIETRYRIGDNDNRYDEFDDNNDNTGDGIRDVTIKITRDLHDALAILEITARNRFVSDRNNNNNDNNGVLDRDRNKELQFRVQFSLQFKLPGERISYGAASIRTARDYEKQLALEQYY